jgi:flagellar motility protein MotE (MotC chaperone)
VRFDPTKLGLDRLKGWTGKLSRPRLLPVVITICGLAAPLYAASVAALGDDPVAEKPQVAAAPAPANAQASAAASANTASDAGVTDLLTRPERTDSDSPRPNLASVSVCEPGLADMLAAERKALAERRAELEVRAQMLAAAEAKAREQLARLEAAGKQVTGLLDRRASMAKADLQRLVAIYESMKPKDAARLLNETDAEILVDLMDLMQERRSAPILAEMDATKVNTLTRTMAQRRLLPGDRSEGTAKTAANSRARSATQTAER